MPGLPQSDWPYPKALVESNEAPRHQCPVGRPGWETFGHPVPKFPENMPEPHAYHDKLQQLLFKPDQIHPSWPRCPQQSSCDGSHRRIGDVHQHHCQWFSSVGLQYDRCQGAGLVVIQAEDFQDRLACLGKVSPGCNTLPFYLSVIHLTADRIFPQSTRLW